MVPQFIELSVVPSFQYVHVGHGEIFKTVTNIWNGISLSTLCSKKEVSKYH
jgi:hypothetical protein